MAALFGGRGDREGQVCNCAAVPCPLLPSCPPCSHSSLARRFLPSALLCSLPCSSPVLSSAPAAVPACPHAVPTASALPVAARTGCSRATQFGDVCQVCTTKNLCVLALEESGSPKRGWQPHERRWEPQRSVTALWMSPIASSVDEAPALQPGLCHAHLVLSPCGLRAGWHCCQQEHCPPAILSFWGH